MALIAFIICYFMFCFSFHAVMLYADSILKPIHKLGTKDTADQTFCGLFDSSRVSSELWAVFFHCLLCCYVMC